MTLLCKKLLYYLPAILLFLPYNEAKSVCVVSQDQSIGSSKSGCRDDIYRSLDDLVDHFNSSTDTWVIELRGKSFSLGKRLAVQNVKTLTLVAGANFTPVVHCSNSSFLFERVEKLRIYSVSFVNCGGQYNSTSFDATGEQMLLLSALYIKDCSDVTINDVAVNESSGFGIVMYNTKGTVIMNNSIFSNNGAINVTDGGGGVYIEFTACSTNFSEVDFLKCKGSERQCNSKYVINNCTFKENNASTKRDYLMSDISRAFGKGGGLLISVRGNTTKNSFSLSNCTFEDNQAVWGGGLHIFLTDAMSYTSISVTDCKFLNNSARVGGGGLDIFIPVSHGVRYMQNNSVYVVRTILSNNVAEIGGGTLFSTYHHESAIKGNVTVHFEDCSWYSNHARFSAAVDITSSHVSDVDIPPFPKFTNCTFKSNFVVDLIEVISNGVANKTIPGKATFMITYNRAIFEKAAHFENNNGSALYVTLGVAEFSIGTHSKFVNNSGVHGGAICLKSSSVIQVGGNTTFEFLHNNATIRGGAIYSYSISQHKLHRRSTVLRCFIQVIGEKKDNNFIFAGNMVNSVYSGGRSIFVNSLFSCASICHEISNSQVNTSSLFNCIGNFSFTNSSADKQIAGSGWNFNVTQKQPFKVIPGKEFDLLFNITDSLNHSVASTLKTSVDKNTVVVDPAYSLISDRKMKVHGYPGTMFVLKLERVGGFIELFLHLNIILQECPPGYLYLNRSNYTSSVDRVGSCKCAWNKHSYYGLPSCNVSEFRAYIMHGFWAGYLNESSEGLRTAHCSLNYCFYNSTSYSRYHLLPATAGVEELSSFICNKNRTGVLCGSCIENHSVYFHSPEYKCGPNRNCKYGIILYILSELFPLTVIFVMVMAFNVSFTSGTLNGFILFAQVIDALALDTYSLRDARHVNTIPAFMFIYGFFNLHFFSLDPLSFCLWKGAKTLDIIAFKYVTILFAFCLVLITILVMKSCNVARFCRVLKQRTTRSSVIHGLSTFLVMCYVQCVRVSFDILTPRVIRGLGNDEWEFRVLISGDTELFKGNHFQYAIPALFCLVVIVVPPLILLLWFPTGQKLLSFCRLGESKLPRIINKVLCIYKLTPLLDSFQSCFKDKLRYFAGLYFLYRCLFQVAFCSTFGPTQFYTAIALLLIVMLLLHAIAQPYKKRCYNIIDTLLFVNLAVINALSLFLHNIASSRYYENSVLVANIAQAILIALPFICCLSYILLKISIYVMKLKSKKRPISVLEESLPARLIMNLDSVEESGHSPADMNDANYWAVDKPHHL